MSSASSASAGPGVAPPPLPPAPSSGPDHDRSRIPRPARLVLLALPIVLAVAYLVVQARRRRYALRFTTLDLLDEVAPDRPGWRRHLPAVVLLAATVAATLAVARPAVARELSEPQRIVVLAVDTSLSMQATDVDPSRLDAARPPSATSSTRCPTGSRSAWSRSTRARQLIQPTTNLEAVRRVIDRADLGEGTAIGEAVFLALGAIETASTQLGNNDTERATRPRRGRSCCSRTARPPTAGPTTRPPPRRRPGDRGQHGRVRHRRRHHRGPPHRRRCRCR